MWELGAAIGMVAFYVAGIVWWLLHLLPVIACHDERKMRETKRMDDLRRDEHAE